MRCRAGITHALRLREKTGVLLQVSPKRFSEIILTELKEYLFLASNNNNIMEKAEARFLETQKKAADRSKATAEYMSEAKAGGEDRQAARFAARQGRLDRAAAALIPGEAKEEASAAHRQRQDSSFARRQPVSRLAVH